MNWDEQRHWEDVGEGDEVPAVAFPLSVYRLVVAAGGNRDFNSIHHNAEYARASGASDIYAMTGFLMGAWERTVREFIGLDGTIRKIAGFRMKGFNVVGSTVTVSGRVVKKWVDDGVGFVDLEIASTNRDVTTVGPGTVTVTLPLHETGKEA